MALAGGQLAAGGPLAGAADSVGGRYGAAARDRARPPAEREAAGLIVAAENHLHEEEDAPALKQAEEARAKFLALGHEEGAADALRIIIHVLVYQDRRKEANQMAREELVRIRATASRVGEGKALLSIAEANSERRGVKNREESLSCALEAAKIFRAQGDKAMEATALLIVLNVHLRRRGDGAGEGAVEGFRTAQAALALSREAADRRGEALALHAVALASVRCLALGCAVEALPGGWLGAANEAVRLFQEARLRKLEAFERICIAQWITSENPRKGLRAAEDALAFCREIGSRQEPAALNAVVQAHLAIQDISKAWMKKEAGEAVQKAKTGLVRFRSMGDKFGEGQALSSMVVALLARDNVAEALKAAEDALKIFQILGDRISESAMLQLTSGLHLKEDQPDKALKAAKQINAISQSLHERAVALETIHEVRLQRGEFKKARSTAQELLALCEDEGDKKRAAITRLMISNAHYAEGDFAEAVAVAREAQAILSDLGATREEAQALRVVAEVHAASQEHEAALRAAEKARRLLAAAGEQEQEAATVFLIAQIRLMLLTAQAETFPDRSAPAFLRELADAASATEEAVVSAKRLGNDRLAGSALCVLAQVQLVGLQVEAAQKAAEEAMTIFRELADQRNQACVMCIQADIQLFNGNTYRALQMVDRALKVYQDLGDARGEWVASGIREHIAGPPEEQMEEQLEEAEGRQWTEEEWKRWEEWQQQEQALKPVGQQQPDQQLDKPTRKRPPTALGAKLDMHALNPLDVQRKLSEIVKMTVDMDEGEALELDQPLMQVGVTSKTAVALRNALSEELPGIALPFTMVFDYPSVNAMTDMIMEGASAG